MTSSARTFFDRILANTDPFEHLASFVNSQPPTFETEWLDFKGGARLSDDLKTFSEAVSGFANTEGGVLIWGLDARKTHAGDDLQIDAVSALSLVQSPAAFRSRLQQNIHCTTDPPVQGIEIREVPGPSGEGFVVCFIPESRNKPHRAEQQKNKPYMIRVGDSFVVPNPSLLRQMFYPSVAPRIRIDVAPRIEERNIGGHQVFQACFYARIANEGRATASDLFVRARSNWGQDYMNDGHHWIQIPGLGDSVGFQCVRPFHPGSEVDLCHLRVSGRCRDNNPVPAVIRPLPRIDFAIYCRDTECTTVRVEFGEHDFLQRKTMTAFAIEELVDRP